MPRDGRRPRAPRCREPHAVVRCDGRHAFAPHDDVEPGDGVDEVVGVRRLELITGTSRRRGWSSREKARILVESAVPGANVSEVARRNGLSPQQLFAWRREARELFALSGSPAEPAATVESASFAPVVLVAPAASPPPAPKDARGVIEIIIGMKIFLSSLAFSSISACV